MLTVRLAVVAQERMMAALVHGGVDPGIEPAAEGAVHQHLGALADIGRDHRLGQHRPAELGEHEVDRRGQVGGGVEQRAVEVDDHGSGAQARRAHRHREAPVTAASRRRAITPR